MRLRFALSDSLAPSSLIKTFLHLLLSLSLLLGGPSPLAWAAVSTGQADRGVTEVGTQFNAHHQAHGETMASIGSTVASTTGDHGDHQTDHACCNQDNTVHEGSCCGKAGCHCACVSALALPVPASALTNIALNSELRLGQATAPPTRPVSPPLRPPAHG